MSGTHAKLVPADGVDIIHPFSLEDGEDPPADSSIFRLADDNMDWLLGQLGSPGKFQIVSSFALLFCMFPVIFSDLAPVFITINPKNSTCNPYPLTNQSIEYYGLDDDTCSLLRNESTSHYCRDTLSHEFEEPSMWTVVSEWNLICDEYWMVSLTTTIYFAGVMSGSLAFGHLADRIGRKKCIILCYVCYLPLSLAAAFVPSYWMFLVLRCCIGFFVQGIQSVCFVLVMEFCPPKYREILGGLESAIASTGVMTLTGFAFVAKKWRTMQLVMTLPTILALAKLFIIGESLRWQMVNGKTELTKKNIKGILRWNALPVRADLDACLDKLAVELQLESTLESSYGMLDCFKTPKMRRYTCCQSFMWFTLLFVFYGMSFGLNQLEGNIYVTTIIAAIAEFPSAILEAWAMKRFGRRKPMFFCFGTTGILCVAVAIMTFLSGTESSSAITYTVLFARFVLAGAFSVIYVYANELFPTVIRNTAFGICVFWHTFGGGLASIVLLSGHMAHPALPYAIFGSCCVISSMLVFLQPETWNRKMPDTIAQVEES